MTSIDEQIKEVQRELRLRERVYPGWVQNKRMTQAEADQRVRAMTDVLMTLQRLRNEQRPQLFG